MPSPRTTKLQLASLASLIRRCPVLRAVSNRPVEQAVPKNCNHPAFFENCPLSGENNDGNIRVRSGRVDTMSRRRRSVMTLELVLQKTLPTDTKARFIETYVGITAVEYDY